MFKLHLIEILLRGVPEALIVIFAAYSFSKTVFNFKRYLVSIIFYVVLVYLIKLLPIQIGISNILIIFLYIFLLVYINKIYIVTSIQVGAAVFVIQIFSEAVNIFFIEYILKADVNKVFSDPMLKTLYGIPSLIIFALIVGINDLRLHLKKNKIFPMKRNIKREKGL